MTQENALLERTVALQVYLGKPGTRVKVDKNKVDTNADKEMLHVSKDIFDSEELRKVRRHHGEIRAYVRSRSLPSPLLRGGVYLIPVDLVETVEEKFAEFKRLLDDAMEDFIAAYENGLVDEARRRLGDLFDPADYPSSDRMRRGFRFEYNYLNFSTPGKLSSISSALFEREKQKMAGKWAEAQEEVVTMLRYEMKSLVDHMVDRLKPGENGKSRIFKNSMISNFTDFLETFPFRNVADDAELDRLVGDARALLEGVDPQDLRDKQGLRRNTRLGFDEIKTSLDTLVIDKPSRMISFEDE